MKRFISAILMLSLLFTASMPAGAVVVGGEDVLSADISDGICGILEIVEHDKEMWGLSNVDFSNIYVGDPVHTYEYVDGSFIETSPYYPLFDNRTLIAFYVDIDGEIGQVMQAFVDDVNTVNPSEFALVSDTVACYLYDGIDFYSIAEYPEAILERDLYSPGFQEEPNLLVTKLEPKYRLNYQSPAERVQTYISCPVGFVAQPDRSNWCWAAAVASVANYKNGTSLSAEDVAYAIDPDMGYEIALNGNEIELALEVKYQLDYSYRKTVPSDNVILNNIDYRYPVLGICESPSASLAHMVVINGINVVAGYLTVMDPNYGFATTTFKNGEYVYIVPGKNKEWSFTEGIAHFWKA